MKPFNVISQFDVLLDLYPSWYYLIIFILTGLLYFIRWYKQNILQSAILILI